MQKVRKNQKKGSFWGFYLGFVAVLVCLVIAAVSYVGSLLREYEETQPSYYVEQTMEQLVADAGEGTFFQKYFVPAVQPGIYEADRDIMAEYLNNYTEGEVSFSQKSGSHAEDELFYLVENGENALAEIKLKALGPVETKLTVLNFREWKVESVRPLLEKKDYSLTVPADFKVSVNNMAVAPEDAVSREGNKVVYAFEGLYMRPVFEIKDWEGSAVEYTIKKNEVIAEFYSYDLTLPNSLTITVNGEEVQGEALDGHRTTYAILELEKPEVVISDYYGNSINYEGQTNVPLTYTVITADSRQSVTVDGSAVPREAVTVKANPEFQQLVDYVENLPYICEYNIAVLQADAQISVQNPAGKVLAMEAGKGSYDFTEQIEGADGVPEEIASQIDVLQVAQGWSLFMSADKPFDQVAKYIVKDSYQYKVAHRYANSVDITFISNHVLLDPTFTENQVDNFVWIADNCFSVDISFVKHMRVRTGKLVDDRMNDRFYFVLYDGTNDKKDNPTWQLASMKEILENAD